MVAASYDKLSSHLKDYCDKASDQYETVVVTREDEKNIVILSLEKYNEIMRAANNADYMYKLHRSIRQAEQGRIVAKSMEELEEMEK